MTVNSHGKIHYQFTVFKKTVMTTIILQLNK